MTEPVRDLAHLSHVELLTPKPDESLFYFREILGMEVAGESGDSVYLRGFGDYERSSLKLTASTQPGVGHLAYRTHSPEALAAPGRGARGRQASRAPGSTATSVTAAPTASSIPTAIASSSSTSPSATTAPPELRPALKNQPQPLPGARRRRAPPRPRQLPRASIPARTASSCEDYLGLRLTEQIVLDDGTEAGVWLASNQKSYDVTYTRDMTRTRGRLHHIAFFVDQREDVLRAADIFLEHGIVMESGPHKHAIQQTFFLYTYEPGGNRIEVCAGGFLIFAPDHEPVVWTQAERAKGQAWGMQTVADASTSRGRRPCREEEELLARAGH